MTETERYLSKSSFLYGQKCDARLWLSVYDANTQDFDPHSQIRKKEKESFQALAQTLFPDGVKLNYSSQHNLNHDLTMQFLNSRSDCVLFGGIFYRPPFLARVDILQKTKDLVRIFEIKSSPKMKDDYWNGFYFLDQVLQSSGLECQGFELIHLKPDAVKNGPILAEDFFVRKDITSTYNKRKKSFEADWLHTLSVLNISEFPESGFRKKCTSPKSCQRPDLCWKGLDEGNIFSLRDSHPISGDLYAQGILNIKEIPTSVELNAKQKVQLLVEKTKQPFVDKQKIETFLSRVQFPVSFLDFESINPIVPVFDGSKSFQHIPMQYSLHILPTPESKETDLLHYEFLEANGDDPREKLLTQLKQDLPPNGTIFAFNDYFEKMVLKESTRFFQDYQEWYEKLSMRFLDMAEPFRKLNIYHPDQKGYCGLKDVLEPFTGYSHEHLGVNDGLMANLKLLSLVRYPNEIPNPEKTKTELKEYCKMDTYALYLIYKVLTQV